jgi:hypothetical protein
MTYKRISALLVCTVLVACATQRSEILPPPPPFEVVSAPTDRAVIYFFRPTLDSTGATVTPALIINRQEVARMSASSYVQIRLQAGAHLVELRPAHERESAWAAKVKLCVRAGVNYFAAIWNQAQPSGNRPTTIVVPIGGGGFFPMFIGQGRTSGSVVFEMVAQEIGAESLAGLTLASQPVEVQRASTESIGGCPSAP